MSSGSVEQIQNHQTIVRRNGDGNFYMTNKWEDRIEEFLFLMLEKYRLCVLGVLSK